MTTSRGRARSLQVKLPAVDSHSVSVNLFDFSLLIFTNTSYYCQNTSTAVTRRNDVEPCSPSNDQANQANYVEDQGNISSAPSGSIYDSDISESEEAADGSQEEEEESYGLPDLFDADDLEDTQSVENEEVLTDRDDEVRVPSFKPSATAPKRHKRQGSLWNTHVSDSQSYKYFLPFSVNNNIGRPKFITRQQNTRFFSGAKEEKIDEQRYVKFPL